jgi:hypothetical protein
VKLTGLMQQKSQQQFGASIPSKRGLGGISNEELFEKKMSFKRENIFNQPKQFKNITTMFLTITDVQQRNGIFFIKLNAPYSNKSYYFL